MKGEPPPVPHNNPDDANREWARNIIHHLIVDNNDNTNLPTVNIVFEHDTIPIISTINNYSNNLNYIDENYNVKLPDDIFITKNDILNTNYRIYGSIMTEEISSKHDKLDNNNPPQTSYILPTKNNQVTTSASQTTQLHDHISTAFNTTHRGIYKFQINTQIQNDSGANRSVTNLLSLLHNFKQIDPYPIGGINSETPAIYCTGFGYLKWHSEDKQVLHVPCYYCAESSGTIISPTDIVYTHMDNFSGWQMTTNIDTKTGTFILLARDGVNHIKYPTFMKNNLWYHYLFQPSTHNTTVPHQPRSVVHANFARNTIGVPNLKPNKFYSCTACMSCKFRNRHISRLPDTQPSINTSISQPTKNQNDIPSSFDNVNPGQHLHMDYGFVCGSDWSAKTNDGKLVTSIDKYRAHLLVIDKSTRYIWIYLTRNKTPPLTQVSGLLERFWKYTFATIMTDQGGELSNSNNFKLLCDKHRYILQPTGAYASRQNNIAEKPNQDLAQIMRCLLYSSGLDSCFWSYALRHAVYLKN